jgi:putative transposase
MPRQARLDCSGTLHHVMIRGIEKRRIVDDHKDRDRFVSRLGQCALDTKTAIYAWVLMPNHAHILLHSGPRGLASFMRRFLTGYAVTYNIRHRRHGHLFQNRYKSIVCDEDVYFRELVRYIHLNPLRAKEVKDLSDLDRYPWCGHSVLMGKIKHPWQERDYVLSWFGKTEGKARKEYRAYVKQGILEGSRPDLVGGGLIRSMGGWSEVMSLRRSKEKALCDERILGSGGFVERLLREADEKSKHRLSGEARREKADRMIRELCRREKVGIEEVKGGSRRGRIPGIRSELAGRLIEECGLSLAETGRQLGITTSAVSQAIRKREKGHLT